MSALRILSLVMSSNSRWALTTHDALGGHDLTGRRAVVTGGAGGIGLETARALASAGAEVWVTARTRAKADAAMASIAAQVPTARLRAGELDVGSVASVRRFAGELVDVGASLDLLVNNAGVMCSPATRTPEGYEMQFGTNHLGHFLLTELLMPLLRAAPRARVINVSSAGHTMGDVDFDDPNYRQREYDPFEAYGQSKTANILHAVELQRRFGSEGIDAFAVHPGAIHTDLGRHISGAVRERMGQMIAAQSADQPISWKTIPQGAATSVWAAVDPDLEGRGGVYCEDLTVAEVVDEVPFAGGGVLARAVSPERATRLWTLSEQQLDL